MKLGKSTDELLLLFSFSVIYFVVWTVNRKNKKKNTRFINN